MEISSYTEKLNKVDGNVYVIEEEVQLLNGVYEATLAHDNINVSTLAVYTGPKLTGERIQSFALSTPSLTPWKKQIRIYAAAETVFISYETDGDTVEAEDINRVQESIVKTQEALNTEEARAQAAERKLQINIDAHDAEVAGEIQSLRAADTDLKEKKADVSYVNAEMDKRYTKEQVYTKEEVLRQIEELIGSAPETLDTLKEIADALGNDPNFAGTIMNTLAGKVDREPGKQLTTNDYSDLEKSIVADVNAKKHEHENKITLDKITQALMDNWNAAHNHTGDKNNPHTTTKAHVGLGKVENKSSSDILSELTSENVIAALGYAPEQAYIHPDSGIEAGTYRSVTVNEQGHVTAASNPTNLEGYGITDAAPKTHQHDDLYLKKGAVTWGDLKGGAPDVR